MAPTFWRVGSRGERDFFFYGGRRIICLTHIETIQRGQYAKATIGRCNGHRSFKDPGWTVGTGERLRVARWRRGIGSRDHSIRRQRATLDGQRSGWSASPRRTGPDLVRGVGFHFGLGSMDAAPMGLVVDDDRSGVEQPRLTGDAGRRQPDEYPQRCHQWCRHHLAAHDKCEADIENRLILQDHLL